MSESGGTSLKRGKIIAVGAKKGGVGKTTPILNLAWLRAKEIGNNNVIILDADSRTHSAKIWSSIRSQNPELMPILVMKAEGGKDFMQQIDLLADKGYDIFIDVGGDNETELHAAMVKADILFIPCPPSFMDTFALSQLDYLVGRVKSSWNPNLKAFIFPSMVSPNNLMVADDLKEMMDLVKDLEHIKLFEAQTKNRKAFRRSIKYGKTIFELTPEEKNDPVAIEEMTNFYRRIYA